jgi:hypothetical protein
MTAGLHTVKRHVHTLDPCAEQARLAACCQKNKRKVMGPTGKAKDAPQQQTTINRNTTLSMQSTLHYVMLHDAACSPMVESPH